MKFLAKKRETHILRFFQLIIFTVAAQEYWFEESVLIHA